MSDGQVKKNAVPDYISLNAQRYLASGQNLGVLVRRTSEHFKKFLPL